MGTEQQPSQSPQIWSGPYKGDISALCLLPSTNQNDQPLLLAGSGSQLLVFDMCSFELLLCESAFKGIRIHGIGVRSISLGIWEFCKKSASTTVAVHAERMVKLFKLSLIEGVKKSIKLQLYQTLSRFKHWILDLQFLKDIDFAGKARGLIAIGTSDNAVYLWDVYSSAFICRYECTERCLLYSLRFWGDEIETLLVAAGTIFNEVVVWDLGVKLLSNEREASEEYLGSKPLFNLIPPKRRLTGHEGSIFRIAWSGDGKKLVSVSDDRSMRLWSMETSTDEHTGENRSVLTFYGHTARIWDCCVGSNFFITASEDCTFRIWTVNGQTLAKVTAHIGRGIWRCVYDPRNAILVTAGADSSIKVHSLSKWVSELGAACNGQPILTSLYPSVKVFSFDLEHSGVLQHKNYQLDSNSEYVRCLSLADENSLFVATNQGLLKCINFSNENHMVWTDVYNNVLNEPVVCMAAQRLKNNVLNEIEDWIVLGDGKGFATVICGCWRGGTFSKTYLCKWQAEGERKLLGVYWSESLGSSHVFIADPCGVLCMWNLPRTCNQLPEVQLNTLTQNTPDKCDLSDDSRKMQSIRFKSSFSARIVCLETSPEEEVLVCGDQRGNILAFSLPCLAPSINGTNLSELLPLATFKGAHGISSVASIRIVGKRNNTKIKICTTGRDGCVCTFFLEKVGGSITCLRVEKVAAVTILESCTSTYSLSRIMPTRLIASGFTSIDFLICDLQSNCEIVRIPCGGWRRPYSYLIGGFPEAQHCFIFVKDGMIHVHKNWLQVPNVSSPASILSMPNSNSLFSSIPLLSQFHGREVHSVNIISSIHDHHRNEDYIRPVSWIATGSEDGAVRIIRFNKNLVGHFDKSQLQGEHVGGSAVRAITSIKGYSMCSEHPSRQPGEDLQDPAFILISAGAKEVLTCWLLEYEQDVDNKGRTTENLSSRWLNTKRCPRKAKHSQEIEDVDLEDDHRYMAVAAFTVFCPHSRSETCFAVTASSNATVSVHACRLLSGSWVEIGCLDYHKAPVLTVQHVVIPKCKTSKGASSNLHLIVTGATDGTVAVWDLTKIVVEFCHKQIANENAKVYRPPSGRGSQGGRRWKTNRGEGNSALKKNLESMENHQNKNSDTVDVIAESDSKLEVLENGQKHYENVDFDYYVLTPDLLLPSSHQSGVNSLSVSIRGVVNPTCVIVSGGDDQALHISTLKIHDSMAVVSKIECLTRDSVFSAHSSAVKDVWTDGFLVFSTGLDQRLRTWNIDLSEQQCTLVECCQSVIDVPEPAGLHVEQLNRGNYRVAVVGRGLQMFEMRANQTR